MLVLSQEGGPSLRQPCLHPHPNPSLTLTPSLSQRFSLHLCFCVHGVPARRAPTSSSVPHCQAQRAVSNILRRTDTVSWVLVVGA